MTLGERLLASFHLRGEEVIRNSNGKPVPFTPGADGYGRVAACGKTLLYHRLKFCLAHGWLPDRVDHRDTNRANNALANLRPATNQQNLRNRGAQRNNTSGFKCVSRSKGGWRAYIKIDGRQHHLGVFPTAAAASVVYEAAARNVFSNFYKEPADGGDNQT